MAATSADSVAAVNPFTAVSVGAGVSYQQLQPEECTNNVTGTESRMNSGLLRRRELREWAQTRGHWRDAEIVSMDCTRTDGVDRPADMLPCYHYEMQMHGSRGVRFRKQNTALVS